MTDIHPGKRAAAERAVADVLDGALIGLGTGSTAGLFVHALGLRVRAGLRVMAVPTSVHTANLARAEGIPLTTLEDHPTLDLAVDGADAISPDLDLVKGLGGALLREKIVASAARRFVVIADDGKLVQSLADVPRVPVEVVAFGWSRTAAALSAMGLDPLRRSLPNERTEPFVTDGGNYILDCRIPHPARDIAPRIKATTGVVDHGYFLAMASIALVGSSDGSVRVISRSASSVTAG